jgi:hypothetical protein
MSKQSLVSLDYDLEWDVYYYMKYIAEQRGQPEMMESLRLIVDDIIVDLRTRQPEPLTDVTPTDVLLALASQGLARFEGIDSDKYAWAATLELINSLETGGYGIVKRTKRPKIRMDALLTRETDDYLRMCKQIGVGKQHKRLFALSNLFSAEKDGDAIPYKDEDGRLAWKAPEHLQRGAADQ